MRQWIAIALLGAASFGQTAKPEDDIVLKAMLDELQRSRGLRVVDLDPPYYIEYAIEDSDTFTASASLGALMSSRRFRSRTPQIQVRIGDYAFDNTNHVYSSAYSGSRLDADPPLDDNYNALRHYLWLTTDRAYKTAVEAIARKRASIKNMASPETLANFSKAEPARSLKPVSRLPIDTAAWTLLVRGLSGVFADYPEIVTSGVDIESFQGTSYFVNSEGSVERVSDRLVQLRIQARGQAADGMFIHQARVVPTLELNGLPQEADLRRLVTETAEDVQALLKAPLGEDYAGPVMFEARAAGQLMAQVLGDNLRIPRRPIADAGRPVPFIGSELEPKLGSRILPDWIDIVDDPTQTEWRGRKLVGQYEFDLEGMAPTPLVAVEKGVLKGFLMTRQPVKGSTGSNGRARLGGNFGARTAAISNLFIKASETKPVADLKKQLIELCQQRNKAYGMLIRTLDYPSSATTRELQGIAQSSMQSGGGSRPVSPPMMVFKVYPDGREELVRGLRFRGVSTRSLRDIVAASDENFVFDFVNNGAPFAVIGVGGYLAPSSVITPSLLFEELELSAGRDEQSKPPLVPAPPLVK